MSNELSVPTRPANGFDAMLSPSTIPEIDKLCETLASSGMVPQAYAGKPKAIAIAGAMGHRLGVDIFSALAGIAVINGRPAIWGDLMLAVCQSNPAFEDIEETVSGKGDDTTAVCTVHRKGRRPYVTTFSFADAKTAGLWGKQGPWTTNPKRMCGMRARAFGLRAVFADILSGMVSREEMEDADLIEVQGTSVPDPKPAKTRAVKEKDVTTDNVKPQAGDALVQSIVKHEETKHPAIAKQKADDASFEKSAAEKASVAQNGTTAPLVMTIAHLVTMVSKLVEEYGERAYPGIRKINDSFGVKKTGEIPAEGAEKAATMIIDLTRELAEGPSDGAK